MNQATELTLKHLQEHPEKYSMCTSLEWLKAEIEKNKNDFLGMIEKGSGTAWSWRKAREDWDSVIWLDVLTFFVSNIKK